MRRYSKRCWFDLFLPISLFPAPASMAVFLRLLVAWAFPHYFFWPSRPISPSSYCPPSRHRKPRGPFLLRVMALQNPYFDSSHPPPPPDPLPSLGKWRLSTVFFFLLMSPSAGAFVRQTLQKAVTFFPSSGRSVDRDLLFPLPSFVRFVTRRSFRNFGFHTCGSLQFGAFFVRSMLFFPVVILLGSKLPRSWRPICDHVDFFSPPPIGDQLHVFSLPPWVRHAKNPIVLLLYNFHPFVLFYLFL